MNYLLPQYYNLRGKLPLGMVLARPRAETEAENRNGGQIDGEVRSSLGMC